MGKQETEAERERRLAYHRAYYQANKVRARQLYEANLEKKREQDKARRSSPEWKAKERERRRSYYEAHRDEAITYARTYYEANAEDVKAKQRARYQAADAAKRAAYYRQRAENPETKARDRVKKDAWRAANKERGAEVVARRRVRIMGGQYEVIDRKAVWARDAGTCRICGSSVEPNNWHLDHIIPLSRGGSHIYDNVAVTHPICNMRKHGADPRVPGSPYAYLLEQEAG